MSEKPADSIEKKNLGPVTFQDVDNILNNADFKSGQGLCWPEMRVLNRAWSYVDVTNELRALREALLPGKKLDKNNPFQIDMIKLVEAWRGDSEILKYDCSADSKAMAARSEEPTSGGAAFSDTRTGFEKWLDEI